MQFELGLIMSPIYEECAAVDDARAASIFLNTYASVDGELSDSWQKTKKQKSRYVVSIPISQSRSLMYLTLNGCWGMMQAIREIRVVLVEHYELKRQIRNHRA